MVPVSPRDFCRRHLDPVPHLLAVRPADAEVHGEPPQIGSLLVAHELRGTGKLATIGIPQTPEGHLVGEEEYEPRKTSLTLSQTVLSLASRLEMTHYSGLWIAGCRDGYFRQHGPMDLWT